MLCPCFSKKNYEQCCKPFLEGVELPPTPEILMRSRFSAYALNRPLYIIETTDRENPSFREDRENWAKSIQIFCTTTAFQGLEVLSASHSRTEGTVKFHARLQSLQGADTSFTEESRFIFRKGRWYYLSGTIL